MNLDAVRTFVAAADAGQFQDAAADLSITQQAVSKRIAGLERDLGVQLFGRTARGARLTADGQAFLPHARALLQAEQRAADAVRPGRPLRVDVINPRIAPARLLSGFHDAHPDLRLEVVAARTLGFAPLGDVGVHLAPAGLDRRPVDRDLEARMEDDLRGPPGVLGHHLGGDVAPPDHGQGSHQAASQVESKVGSVGRRAASATAVIVVASSPRPVVRCSKASPRRRAARRAVASRAGSSDWAR